MGHLARGRVHVKQQQSHGSLLQVGLALSLLVSIRAVEELECIIMWRHALPLACSSTNVRSAKPRF